MEVCATCERLVPDPAAGCPNCRASHAEATAIEPEPPAAPAGIGGREVAMVAVALIGSGAITLALLTARGGVTAKTAAPVSVATPVRAVAPAPAPAAVVPGWTENAAVWTGTDRKSTAFELAARNETQVWMKRVRPLLVVRCIARRIDVFVYTDSAAAMETRDADHTVRIALDGAAERSERWPDSVAHDALFAPDGAAFVSELVRAETLRFGYTPHNAPAVVAEFALAGLGDRLTSAAAYCAAGK